MLPQYHKVLNSLSVNILSQNFCGKTVVKIESANHKNTVTTGLPQVYHRIFDTYFFYIITNQLVSW